MAKVIAIVTQKGGVGKTTSAVNLASVFGELGHRTLLVDIDPQGNATSGVGLDKRQKLSTYDLLCSHENPGAADIRTAFAGLSVIPSAPALAGAEIEMVDMPRRENRLKAALAAYRDRYDYILIDCPPALGLLTLNALVAADTFLIPAQTEYYALEGLSQLIATVRQVKRLYNPGLELEGVMFTMYDGRTNLTQQVVAEVKKFFPRKVYGTVIPRSVRLAEAPGFGRPINYYDKGCKGAKAYHALAEEILSRQ
ncbi:MAG: ParA family protein [Ruminococcaceae bacterium]|nr:ParA family protein [Oscillospiraceae bacterium]